jgi:hypothetical protein
MDALSHPKVETETSLLRISIDMHQVSAAVPFLYDVLGSRAGQG